MQSTSKLQDFMQQAKENALKNAQKMAALELSVWNEKHETELKSHFGFTDKKLAIRKIELLKTANA